MNRRFLLVLTFGSFAMCSLIGYRHFTSIAAEGERSADQSVPPEIKKGVVIGYYQPAYPVTDSGGYFDPTVEEVRGKWVRLKWEPNEPGKKAAYEVRIYWVNFETVNAFRILATASPKKAEEK